MSSSFIMSDVDRRPPYSTYSKPVAPRKRPRPEPTVCQQLLAPCPSSLPLRLEAPIVLPSYSLPSTRRNLSLHPSICHQLDGMLFTLFGVRLEVDVCAHDETVALCGRYGLRRGEALSSFISLVLHDPSALPAFAAAVLSARACALVVAPLVRGKPPLLRIAKSPNRPSRLVPWFDALLEATVMQFPLGDGSVSASGEFVALFVRAGKCPRFKSKSRPDRIKLRA